MSANLDPFHQLRNTSIHSDSSTDLKLEGRDYSRPPAVPHPPRNRHTLRANHPPAARLKGWPRKDFPQCPICIPEPHRAPPASPPPQNWASTSPPATP